jgi:hypothetical protein
VFLRQVHLCAAIGMPMNRLMASIPRSDALSWIPLNGNHSSSTVWRCQALGTSMTMAFFLNNNLLSAKVAEEQVNLNPKP